MTDSKLPLAKQLVERASFFYRKRSTKEGDRAWRDSELLYASAALLRQQNEALVGLVGLTELLSHRDDLPAEVRNVLATSHRVIAAESAIKTAAEGEQS